MPTMEWSIKGPHFTNHWLEEALCAPQPERLGQHGAGIAAKAD